jgi:putative tRNA adenosine deaminase-associated protein
VGHNEQVPYFAAVFAQTEAGWVGTEADLIEAKIMDDVSDLLRESGLETGGDPVVLLVEEDDEWFAVLRLDGEEDPRVFLSDARAIATSELAALLYQFIGAAEEAPEGGVDGAPDGDRELLEDLGTDTQELEDLSERSLPTDALLIVAERAGFADEFDRLHE